MATSAAWECSGCTFSNASSVTQCDVCETPRPSPGLDSCVSCGSFSIPGFACTHVMCKACTRRSVLAQLAQGTSTVPCVVSSCSIVLSTKVAQSVLDPKEFERYSNLCLLSLVAEDEDLSACPQCQCVVEIVFRSKRELAKLQLQTQQSLQSGEVLGYEEYCHYSQFRIRCRNCTLEYCAKCKISPYHIGFTCEGHQANLNAVHCHFCKVPLTDLNSSTGYGVEVCTGVECLQLVQESCRFELPCGHTCGGLRGEKTHLYCMEPDCEKRENKNEGRAVKADLCNICWVEELGDRPSLQVQCGHVFHYHCLLAKMRAGYPGPRISFGFLLCPLCKALLVHSAISHAYLDHEVLYKSICAKALQRLPLENMENDPKLSTLGHRYYNNKLQFALDSFAFYNCFKCKKPYYGGKRDCENVEEGRPFDEFVCFDCCNYSSAHCKEASHREFHSWKCRFCCLPAVWFCWGTTHFCERCHSHRPYEKALMPRESFSRCDGPKTCPLKVAHPPNGAGPESEFLLGCAMCLGVNGRNAPQSDKSNHKVSVSEMKSHLVTVQRRSEQTLLFVDRAELVDLFVASMSVKQTRALLEAKGHDTSHFIEAREMEAALRKLCC